MATTCPSGQHLNTATNACVACATGQIWNPNTNACVQNTRTVNWQQQANAALQAAGITAAKKPVSSTYIVLGVFGAAIIGMAVLIKQKKARRAKLAAAKANWDYDAWEDSSGEVI